MYDIVFYFFCPIEIVGNFVLVGSIFLTDLNNHFELHVQFRVLATGYFQYCSNGV